MQGEFLQLTSSDEFMMYPAIDMHGYLGSLPGNSGLLASVSCASTEEMLRQANSCCVEIVCAARTEDDSLRPSLRRPYRGARASFGAGDQGEDPFVL